MNYFMVQKFGIYGVITTSIVTYGVLLAYRLHDMRRYFKLKLYRLTWIPIFNNRNKGYSVNVPKNQDGI